MKERAIIIESYVDDQEFAYYCVSFIFYMSFLYFTYN